MPASGGKRDTNPSCGNKTMACGAASEKYMTPIKSAIHPQNTQTTDPIQPLIVMDMLQREVLLIKATQGLGLVVTLGEHHLAPGARTQAGLAWHRELPAEAGADVGDGFELHTNKLPQKKPQEQYSCGL